MSSTIHPLKTVAAELDGMRVKAVADAHPMLALLLQLARDEATEQLTKRTAKRRKPAVAKASNVIRFPRRRLAKRRNARALTGTADFSRGEVLRFADYVTG